MIPSDDEEHRIIDCWTLSLKSGFNSAENENSIVTAFCDRYELDTLEVIRLCKSMTTAFNSTKQK